MPRLLRQAAILLLAALVALALSATLLIGWLLLDRSDPDRLAGAPLPEIAAITVLPYAGKGCPAGRVCQDVILETSAEPPLRLALSLPENAGAGPMPVVILAGGLQTGRAALRHLPDLGRNALVTYEYPLDAEAWRRASLPAQIVAARAAALAVPGQLAAAIRWTRAQPWADPARVSLVGVSLGALVLPAAQRLAAAHGAPVQASILAYGGTDLAAILRANYARERPWLGPVAWLCALGLRALEPAAHLPHLQGAFLLINGRDDARIPAGSAAGLRRLTPAPKEVAVLPSGHIDADRQQRLDEILALSRRWLAGRQALAP
jgi:dienelactone hydrolase